MEATIDRCDIDIEGPGDFADGLFFFFNELASKGHWSGRTLEMQIACLDSAPSLLDSYGNQRAFGLRDAREDGEHHAPGSAPS